MKENVLDVLMYLFENYFYDEPDEQPDRASMEENLHEAGFSNGEIDKAFEWLNRGIQTQDPYIFYIVLHPSIDNLRDDPRWDQFLRKAAPTQIETTPPSLTP